MFCSRSDENIEMSDDELPAGVDLADPFFAEEIEKTDIKGKMKNSGKKKKKKEKTDENEEDKRRKVKEYECIVFAFCTRTPMLIRC